MKGGSGAVQLDPSEMATLVIVIGLVTLFVVMFVFGLVYLLLGAVDRAASRRRS